MDENRKYPRKDVKVQIEVNSEADSWDEALLHDISISGAKIELTKSPENPPVKKQTVYIQSLFPGNFDVIESTVEWIKEDEGKTYLGINFVQSSISDDIFVLIKKAVAGSETIF